jgi:uncharacterized RDD family membrane protein YckC
VQSAEPRTYTALDASNKRQGLFDVSRFVRMGGARAMHDPSIAMSGDVAGLAYAGVGSRFIALLIDGIILGIIGSVIGLIVDGDPASANGTTSLLSIVISAAYFIGMIGSTGMTLGGRVLGVKVVDANGQQPSYGTAAIRWIGSYVSAIILLIGYLMAFWDSKKQTLHDKIASTYVVKV